LLKEKKPVLALASMILEYDYAVHKISKRNLPKTVEKTYLLVFRNAGNQVKFIELNAVTFQLLNLIKENEFTGKQTLAKLAEDIKHPAIDDVIRFGADILADLAKQEAIIGTK